MKQLNLLLLTVLILALTNCMPISDCDHNFIYQGKIKARAILFSDSLVIRFKNLGDVIFNDESLLLDSTIINNSGDYKVIGDFFTACASDKDIFDKTDSLDFEVLNKGHIIKKGKFRILDINRQYIDSLYLTILNLPVINID